MFATWLALLVAATAATADAPVVRLAPGTVFAAPEGAASIAEAAGVACDAFGHVWATDAAGHRLVRWDASGSWLGESGSLGSDANQFRRPTALARLGSLGVAVLDEENRRVIAYDQLGRLTDLVIDLDASDLVSVTGRIRPVALAADRGGAIAVADADRDRVLVFGFDGRYQRTVGGYGVAPGTFHGLAAVAFSARGELVTLERAQPAPKRARGAAADSVSRGAAARVQWLEPGGSPLASWTLDDTDARDFALAVDDSGRVAIALAGGRHDELRLYARDGTLLARTTDVASPRALAFAPDGALLVAEAGAADVRRFERVAPAGE